MLKERERNKATIINDGVHQVMVRVMIFLKTPFFK